MEITGADLRLAAARSTTIRTTPARSAAPSFAASRSAAARSTTTRSTAARYTAPSSTAAGFAASRSSDARSTTTRSSTARYTAPSCAAAGFAASRSVAARFAPMHRAASRLLPLRCASDAPPAPQPEALPPKESPSKWKLVVSKLWTELMKDGLSWGFLIASLFVGYLATKEHPNAIFLITICEKGEKLYKFVSHFVPILVAIVKCFW